jgi:phage gpG-like protein
MFTLDIKFDPQQNFYNSFMALKRTTPKQMEIAMRQILVYLISRVKDKIATNFRRNKGSGKLRASWGYHPPKTENGVTTGVFGSDVYYSRWHEFGKIVTPTTKAALTIPFWAAKKAFPPAHDLKETGKTFINKGGIIFLKQGGKYSTKYTGQAGLRGRYIPVYVLRKYARIPARPYLKPVLDYNVPQIMSIINKSLTHMIQSKGR